MSIWMLIAAAASNGPIAAEAIGNPARGWVRSTDIPVSEWKQGSTTGFDLTIDQMGRTVRCEITRPSGSAKLDTLICELVMKRARFLPARDASGKTVPSVMRNHIRWRPNRFGKSYIFDEADIVISTQRPLGQKSSKRKPLLVELVQVQDASGTIEACRDLRKQASPELIQLACETAQRPDIAIPVKDASGAPVRGIRSYLVGFDAREEGAVYIR